MKWAAPFQTFKNRLVFYVLITEEIGAPTKKYQDLFIESFGRMIHKGNCCVTLDIETTLQSILTNGDAHETPGGINFFRNLPAGATRAQLEDYINSFFEGGYHDD